MQSIKQTEFFRLLIKSTSAKVGVLYFKQPFVPTDEWVRQEVAKVVTPLKFRVVEHTQTNGMMFEGGSWLMYRKRPHVDSRTTYKTEIDGKTYIILVDHRPAYQNQFGTQINEQAYALLYQLQPLETPQP
jgi:hypothetical protein